MLTKEARDYLALCKKKIVLGLARNFGSDAKAYRFYGVPRSTFYRWKRAFDREGEAGLVRKKPVAINHPRRLLPEVVEKVLHLRRTYHLGPQRITWYLERYHGIRTPVPPSTAP